jgi:ParB-like chromosome segregation protein Spo0J
MPRVSQPGRSDQRSNRDDESGLSPDNGVGSQDAIGTIEDLLVVRRVRLDEIHLDPANTNTHNPRNIQAIIASLKEFGQVEPLVVQRGTGKVIGGNGRLEAMHQIGMTECDIVEIDADGVRATALGIALNRTASLSEFDDKALTEILRSLQSEDFPIEATGFTDQEIDELLEKLGKDKAGGDQPDAPVEHISEKWIVVIECTGEQQQVELIARFQAEGLSVKAIVA